MIIQENLQGIIIGKFNSISQASKILKYKRSAIVNCCRGKQKSLKGSIFKIIKKNGIQI